MKPSELKIALHGLLNAKLTAFIWGSPGIGKSDIVAQVAAERSTKGKPYELRDVRLGLMDPTDIKGFPNPDAKNNVMRWLPPDFLPTKGQGLLFLDEMNSAPGAVQAAAYQLVLNRKVGNYELPPGWDVVAAGNNETDRAVTHRMSTALASRMEHLFLDVDVDEWCAHAADNGIHEHRIAFIRFRSQLLHMFDPNTKTHAFPCPRTWFFADRICRQNMPRHIERMVLGGTVGEGAATEYTAFIQVIRELPTIDEIKIDPARATLPKTPAAQHAISTTLSLATKDESGYETFMKYLTRLPREFQVVYNRDCLRTKNDLKYTPTFKDWSMANADVLL
jgi:hypothetical protein